MFGIIADVVSLTQYVLLKDDLNYCRPERCICCGKAGVWFHGCYPRKPDRVPGSNRQLNPVLIQRFFCRSCRHTFSQLPECIAPRRWYLWEVQQLALLLLLAGKSACAAAKESLLPRRTITRWFHRFSEQFLIHRDALCNALPESGGSHEFQCFWQRCLAIFSLAKAMRLCHVAGVCIP
jgi:transposase-like protein